MWNTIRNRSAKMKLEDLRKEDQQEFLAAFAADPTIIKMEQACANYQRQGKWVQALQMRKKIEQVKVKTFDKFMDKLDKAAERVNLCDTEMTQEQRDKLNTLCVTLFMACDVIDSAVVDMKEILQDVDCGLEFLMFDDIKRVIESARSKIRFMNNASDVAQNVVWGDTSDDMYNIIQNKARSVIRKREEAGEHWGDRFEAMKAR